MNAVQFKAALVDAGLIEAAVFEEARRDAERRGQAIDVALVEKNLIPDEYIGQVVADALGFPFARLEKEKIADHVLRIVPERMARRSRVIAFGTADGELKVALRDPEDLELVRFLEKKTGKRVRAHFATERGIGFALERYASDLDAAMKALLQDSAYLSRTPEERAAAAAKGEEDDETVITAVHLVLNYAYQHGASDVHIEPREKEVVIRYRIDGILHDVVTVPKGLLDAVVTRVKILARLRTDEHFAAQDGKLQEVVDGERIDVRVSVLPVVDGEKIVMRLLSEKGKRFSLDDLGFSARDMKTLRRHMQKSFGMILATGPTGSGKTTTMYAVLKILNTRDVNIATIEDPIEYAIEGVNQIQANPKTGLTFAAGLRSIVRQDPDIVMVGEIRDEETAGIAVNAAMTGHLVLSTLHTNDAATTLPRFRDMKVEPFLIASTINCIIAQRLIRRICTSCVVSDHPTHADLAAQGVPESVAARFLSKAKSAERSPLYRGKGCERCNHTGYLGRIGVFEVLEVDDAIRDLIMKGANASVIARLAAENGMTTMFEDGLEKVAAGLTTVEEVMRVTGG